MVVRLSSCILGVPDWAERSNMNWQEHNKLKKMNTIAKPVGCPNNRSNNSQLSCYDQQKGKWFKNSGGSFLMHRDPLEPDASVHMEPIVIQLNKRLSQSSVNIWANMDDQTRTPFACSILRLSRLSISEQTWIYLKALDLQKLNPMHVSHGTKEEQVRKINESVVELVIYLVQ